MRLHLLMKIIRKTLAVREMSRHYLMKVSTEDGQPAGEHTRRGCPLAIRPVFAMDTPQTYRSLCSMLSASGASGVAV